MGKGEGEKKAEKKSLGTIVNEAFGSAFRGGLPGLVAMAIQVLALMWMRTLVNYQYSKGGTFMEGFSTLYAEGGIARFYNGFWPALIVGPLSRFGDVAANSGILSIGANFGLDSPAMMPFLTMAASGGAAAWRIIITPVQIIKTAMQVNGAAGLGIVAKKMATDGPLTLWDGAMGTMGATWLGHYPWFLVYNALTAAFPDKDKDGNPIKISKFGKLAKRAAIGFCSSFVSDCVSNGLRVITTAKQTSTESVGYLQIASTIIADGGGGLAGLWTLIGRGLLTKIISNGISAMLFSVLWKYFEDKLKAGRKKAE
eukprot:SAG22_NODE_618_length_8527_cov_6.070123_6_plen_312_part_00